MTNPGLTWLDGGSVGSPGFCLTFVRGLDEAAVLAALGAELGEPAFRTRREASQANADPAHGYGPFALAGRSGDWVFAWEEASSEGQRPEVLRRLSAEGEAVTVSSTGVAHSGFGYALGGEVVTSLVTIVPFTREGSDPDRFLPLIRQAGLVHPRPDGLARAGSDLHAVLTIAEQAFGLSIGQAELDRLLLSARLLPVLPDLPPRPDGVLVAIGDPVPDLLLAYADNRTRMNVAAAQARGVLADSNLDRFGDLASAVQESLDGHQGLLADETPAGIALRRIRRDAWQAQVDGYHRRPQMTAEQRRVQAVRGHAADCLHRVLGWGPVKALPAVVYYRRRWGDRVWREQLLRDLSGVRAPAAELQQAERRWQSRRQDGGSTR